jgi:hypothetical protein
MIAAPLLGSWLKLVLNILWLQDAPVSSPTPRPVPGTAWSIAGRHPRTALQANLCQPGAEKGLASDERGATRGTGLLGVVIGEECAFLGNMVDVRRLVAHHPVALDADVRYTDVIAHNDEDVRFLVLRLQWSAYTDEHSRAAVSRDKAVTHCF